MKVYSKWAAMCCLAVVAVGCASSGEPIAGATSSYAKKMPAATLIPREIIFGNPDKASVQISPDGKHLAFLAPVNGVLNVWVGPVDRPDAAKPVTFDRKRGIRRYFWAYTNSHVLYMQDKGGDENWRVYSVNLKTDRVIDLTPMDKVAAQVQGVSHKFPNDILVSLNDRDPKFHDIYKINITTGERTLVRENNQFVGFLTDDDFNVRFGQKSTPDGGMEFLEPDGHSGWKRFALVGQKDALTTQPFGFDKTGKTLYMVDSRGRNTAALKTIDLGSGKERIVGQNNKADIGGLMIHPTEKTIEAYSVNFERNKWTVLDPAVKRDFRYLETVADGDFNVGSRTLDDNQWIVTYMVDDGPVRYYRYNRKQGKAKFLFTNRANLERYTLSKMNPVVIKSRDGLNLVSYLTIPASVKRSGIKPAKPLPMVLFVHGGPWGRDRWGYHPYHQWLSNRGYAVLSVNFRASTGFGKDFINAGDHEWSGKMHDDLIDAVNWAVASGVAQKDKVAIMGGSYGGYATLAGLTFTPNVFACGVDIVGPSNLVTLLNTIPPYWAPMIELFTTRVGDHRTEEGRSMLREASPLTFVNRINKPLLIGQGANDPRVKQSEADQIVTAMSSKNIPVTYVLFPDEGHGFRRPENNKSFNAVTEAFLAEHLGGRFEPIGRDFTGSSITVPNGRDQVPGLGAALKVIGK
jgi:dipeptidyl aminopeptidase/acylaminoacyl peptidase